jgi:hypothetical protein
MNITIGEPYSDGGFLPYTVAIHISYPDEDNIIISARRAFSLQFS